MLFISSQICEDLHFSSVCEFEAHLQLPEDDHGGLKISTAIFPRGWEVMPINMEPQLGLRGPRLASFLNLSKIEHQPPTYTFSGMLVPQLLLNDRLREMQDHENDPNLMNMKLNKLGPSIVKRCLKYS